MADFGLAALTPLILFALWAIVLVLLLAVARSNALRKGKAITSFKAIGDEPGLDRFSRAHMNTLENLPIFAVVYLAALWTDASAPILTLGWVILGARMLQSLIHLSSVSANAIRLRAVMQATQLGSFLWLGIAALLAANASS